MHLVHSLSVIHAVGPIGEKPALLKSAYGLSSFLSLLSILSLPLFFRSFFHGFFLRASYQGLFEAPPAQCGLVRSQHWHLRFPLQPALICIPLWYSRIFCPNLHLYLCSVSRNWCLCHQHVSLTLLPIYYSADWHSRVVRNKNFFLMYQGFLLPLAVCLSARLWLNYHEEGKKGVSQKERKEGWLCNCINLAGYPLEAASHMALQTVRDILVMLVW